MKIISNIQPYIPAFSLHDKHKVIEHVNTFLSSITYILSGDYQYTNANWQERGRRLYAFSQMLIHFITNENCKHDNLIKEHIINYMCTPNKNRLIPMRHLYKVLTNIGLLYIDECLYFYLYDSSNKNKQRVDLTLDNVLENMFNSNLRYSKTDTLNCINHLQSKSIHDINQYMVISIQLRTFFLSKQFCRQYSRSIENEQHSYFENELKDLLQAIEHLMNRSNEYK